MQNGKIVMFYRSKEDSNQLASETIRKLQCRYWKVFSEMDIDFINLDKRNIKKYFYILEKAPAIIYIWHDEEEIIESIKAKYPTAIIKIMNEQTGYSATHSGNGHVSKECNFAEEIIADFRNILGMKTIYKVNDKGEVIKKEVFLLRNEKAEDCFLNEAEALAYAEELIKQIIDEKRTLLRKTEEEIKGLEARLIQIGGVPGYLGSNIIA